MRSAPDVIFDSVMEAFYSALMVWILGGVAISIAGSFAGDMVPSLPPLFAGQSPAGTHHGPLHDAGREAVRNGALVFFFAIFFVHSLWRGFHGEAMGRRGRLARIVASLRENWFSLIVGNAISAWVAVLVFKIAQDVSLWHWLWDAFLSAFGDLARNFLGPSTSTSLGVWFSWYNDNQAKLTFWVIYFGGAFDDLGVPNFKTLARWGWRRFQKRNSPVPAAANQRGSELDTL